MKHTPQPTLFGSLKFKGIRDCMGVEPAPSSGAFGEPKGHDTHTVRENSLTAYHGLDLGAREREVLAALEGIGRPATDREVMAAMGSKDPNVCRPRLTSLVKAGVLYEVGTVIDATTGRPVRRCWFTERAPS